VDGAKTARFSLVVGKNHKAFEKNMTLAEAVRDAAEAKYPGLFKNLIESEKNKYNQDLSENLLLVELGSYGNTLEEAMQTAEYLADILSGLTA